MTTVIEWKPVPQTKVWRLVARLKHQPTIDGGGSLHVAEVHVRDTDGTLYRFFRGMSDTSGIAADDELEQAHEVVVPEAPKSEPLTIDNLVARLEAYNRGGGDPTLARDIRILVTGPELDGSTASPYALHAKLTRSIDACHDFMVEHLPGWRVASVWEVPDGWSVRLTDRVGIAVSPPEDFGRPKIETRTVEAMFKTTVPIAFITAILLAMKADNYRP